MSRRCPLELGKQNWKKRPNKLSSYVWNGCLVNCGDTAYSAYHYKISNFPVLSYLSWEPDDNQASASILLGVPMFTMMAPTSLQPLSTLKGKGEQTSCSGCVVLALDGHVIFMKQAVYKNEATISKARGD